MCVRNRLDDGQHSHGHPTGGSHRHRRPDEASLAWELVSDVSGPSRTVTDGYDAENAGSSRRETPDSLRLLAALLVIAVTTGLLLGTAALMLAVAPG